MKRHAIFGLTMIALFVAIATAVIPTLQTAKSFTVACGTSATILDNSSGGYNSILCTNMSTTSVFLGGTDVSTTNAPCISTDSTTCFSPAISWDVSRAAVPACRVASGSVTLKCLAGK